MWQAQVGGPGRHHKRRLRRSGLPLANNRPVPELPHRIRAVGDSIGGSATMSVLSRINRIEKRLGSDSAPRQVTIWCGPHYEENWIEWNQGWNGNGVALRVKTPDHQADVFEFLTPEQESVIRPGDSVVVIRTADNRRDPHLELNRPPWKRRAEVLSRNG
jgi:hypothetical protein